MITLLTAGEPVSLRSDVRQRDVYDLAGLEPECRLPLIRMHTDQIHLDRNRDVIDGFLARGGTLVVCGHIVRPIFTGAPMWRVAASTSQTDLGVTPVTPHPVWEGVDPRDISSRRGVSGFYGRGGYPELPAGSVVINRVHDAAVDVELRRNGGRVLLHGGNDLWGYRAEGNSAERILPQLLRWGTEDWV